MSIELNCTQCGTLLRLADEHAGKRARCPDCQYIFTVPETGAPPSQSAVDMWHVRTEDGSTYGPVARTELSEWVTEGRITADTLLRRDGKSEWQNATALFPVLGKSTSITAGGNPFADTDPSRAANPYASPAGGYSTPTFQPSRNYRRAHRGGTILTLGIFAIICNVCFIPGICAWSMGSNDLNAMRTGMMDPSGQGLTQAGMILGIIGTILSAIMFVLQFLVAAADM